MWGSKKKARARGATTLISRDTDIVGDVHFSGTLDIEGLVQGNVVARPECDALVRVVGKGRVEGDIRAPRVVINGTVQGDVHSSAQLELAPRGKVSGNVYYHLVQMAAGAQVNGSLNHVDAATADKGGAAGPAARKQDAAKD